MEVSFITKSSLVLLCPGIVCNKNTNYFYLLADMNKILEFECGGVDKLILFF